MPADMLRDRGAAFQRFSRAVDGPLTVLALVLIPLIVCPWSWTSPRAPSQRSWPSTT
jgi:hypothetical protein